MQVSEFTLALGVGTQSVQLCPNGGKAIYATQEAAISAANRRVSSHTHGRVGPFKAVACPLGGHYHVEPKP